MTVDAWLQSARADARQRALDALLPLLGGLATSTRALREADGRLDAEVPRHHAAPQTSKATPGADRSSHAVSSSIERFARSLRAGETTAAQTMGACLECIARDNPRLNAFIHVDAEQAMRDAQTADRELASGHDRGPLHGVPVSVKDLFDVEGTCTTAASRVREGHVARRDAELVARLRRAGAVLVGKTNLHEFAFGTTNEDSAFGPARHPRDPHYSPGGSSGGSAVSVATGMAFATLGTDTGGSIRIPASVCGLVGLKPTSGELTTDGTVALSHTLDHAGPLTTSVSDAWHVFHALRGDSSARPIDPLPANTLRFGVPRGYLFEIIDADVRQPFDAALSRLREAGVEIHDVAIPDAALTATVYLHLVFGDAAALHGTNLDTVPDRYTPNVRLRLELSRYVLAEDYVRARRWRERLRLEVDAALTGVDALVLPTLPITAPRLGVDTISVDGRDEQVRALMLRLTQLFNITGHPAVTLPCGRSPRHWPVGIQAVGTRGQTDALLRAAAAIERALV